jgi:hypothetical protein
MRYFNFGEIWIYIQIAALVTAYQAWRGWFFQWKFSNSAQEALGRWKPDQGARPASPSWLDAPNFSPWEIQASRCLEDALFYAVCTAAGFVSLFLAYRLFQCVALKDISVGTGGLFVFLAAVGVLGTAGQLPYWIQTLGKFPGTPTTKV